MSSLTSCRTSVTDQNFSDRPSVVHLVFILRCLEVVAATDEPYREGGACVGLRLAAGWQLG